jgi:sulfatase maturation enzyme AslB (radical SAM superfamily)
MADFDRASFCYYPFFQVLMTANGKFKACCKQEDVITQSGKELSTENASIAEAWNSDFMKGLRQSFHDRKPHPSCRECWRQEAVGIRPMRLDSFGYGVPKSQVLQPRSPMRVEINASNVCNLRCRICNPLASSRWIPEAAKLVGWNEKIHRNLVGENLATVQEWVPGLKEIGLFGGEPLLSKENLALLKYCVESGHSKHITVLLNTNGTVYSDEIVGLFKRFQKVLLNFSIDDIHQRFEYQRDGARFEAVMSNIRKYVSHGGLSPNDPVECKICCSVTNMNAFYFPEYFQFMNENFPGMAVFLNFVFDPWAFSIEILPGKIKKIVRERLRGISTSFEMSSERTRTIEEMIRYLDNEPNRDFGEFFRVIERHDRYRKQDFAKTFPEFWDEIREFRPGPVTANRASAGPRRKPDSPAQIGT